MSKKRMLSAKRDALTGYAFVLPGLLFLLGFVLYPILYNIIMSFQDVNLKTLNSVKPFVALANYKSIFSTDLFWRALGNTLYFTIFCIVFQFIIGFALALYFARQFFLNKFTRGILLVCWLVPNLIVASLWRWIFTGDASGVLNYILMSIGLIHQPISFLTSSFGAMHSLIVANIWRGIPFNMLLLATALTTLPPDIFEAARIDGASRRQSFLHITLPLLKPSIISVITLGFIYTFKAFELIYIMTNGGPVDATENLATISYKFSFINFEFSKSAAIANVMMLVLMIVAIINLKFVNKDEVMS